jgi:hypothetical protein
MVVEVLLEGQRGPRWAKANSGQYAAWRALSFQPGVYGGYELMREYRSQGNPGDFYIRRLPHGTWRKIRDRERTIKVKTDAGWKPAWPGQRAAWRDRYGPTGHGHRVGNYETRVHYEGQGNPGKVEIRRRGGTWREIKMEANVGDAFFDLSVCS